jgi:hypothetical protein
MCPRSHKGQEKSSHLHSIDNESPQVHSVDTRHLPAAGTHQLHVQVVRGWGSPAGARAAESDLLQGRRV